MMVACRGLDFKTASILVLAALQFLWLSFTHLLQWEVADSSVRGKTNSLRFVEDKTLKQNVSNNNRANSNIEWKMPVNDFAASERKLILIYTTVYGKILDTKRWRTKEEKIQAPKLFDDCLYKCEWSINRSDYNRSAAVIFHLYNMSPDFIGHGYREFVISDLPTRYSQEQKWVLMVKEPNSFFYPEQLKLLDNMFNLTMTFQADADVKIPYGHFWKMSSSEAAEYTKNSKHYLQSRRYHVKARYKMTAWLVSNCVTSSRREEYVKELQKYTRVDIYGECGSLKSGPGYSDTVRNRLAKSYKFYLAFENSDCDDYVTEKFWHSLKSGMVPIVRGKRVKYREIAPPNSYIHADDFASPAELAKYLEQVSRNATLYQSYHKWRLTYAVESRMLTGNRMWMCDLCTQVHKSPRQTVNVYEQFSEDRRCDTFDRNRNRSGEHMEDIVHYIPLDTQ